LTLAACGDGGDDSSSLIDGGPPVEGTSGVQTGTSNSPPEISGSPSSSATVGSPYEFTPAARDADGDDLTFSVENLPDWATFTPETGLLQGTPPADGAGAYDGIVIAVSDGESMAALPPFSIDVAEVESADDAPDATAPESSNHAPTIAGQPGASVVPASGYSFKPSATDPDGDTLSFSIEGKPAWASFDAATGALSGTPSAADVGTYDDIVISVSDGDATAELPAFAIAVEAVADGSATLSWVAPTERTDGTPLTNLAGFKIYWGQEEGKYPNVVTLDNPGLATYVVENLGSGTWYFTTTAFDVDGVESDFSNVASMAVP
jgi:hypothetical protein